MTTLATRIPDALAEAPKSELIEKVMQLKSLATKHRVKERAMHGAKMGLSTLVAGAGGGLAGAIAAFNPHIPRTKVRWDLAAAGGIALGSVFGLFGSADRYMNSLANGAIGFGTGDMVRNAVAARRGKK
jgi:hypothetical protein